MQHKPCVLCGRPVQQSDHHISSYRGRYHFQCAARAGISGIEGNAPEMSVEEAAEIAAGTYIPPKSR